MEFLYKMGISMFIERDWIGIMLLIACILLFTCCVTWRVYQVSRAREYRDKLPTTINAWLDEEKKELYRKQKLNREIKFEELLEAFLDRKNVVDRKFLRDIWEKWIIDGQIQFNHGFGGYLIFPLYDPEYKNDSTV